MVEDSAHTAMARGQVAAGPTQEIQIPRDLLRDLVTDSVLTQVAASSSASGVPLNQVTEAHHSRSIFGAQGKTDSSTLRSLQKQCDRRR